MEEEKINLTEIIINTLNELFSKMFSSIDNTIYSILDELSFIKPDILNNNLFKKIIGESNTEGILLICNSLVLGFILYYAINYLISHLIYSKIDSPKQFIFKCIIFISLMNSSIWICEQIINIISLISFELCNLGKFIFDSDICFSNFIDNINKNIYYENNSLNIFSFDGIIKSFTSFGLINLIFTFSLRYIMIQIFILISPFAFLTLINTSTEWFFKTWLKNFISLLLLQILISVILLLSFSLKSIDNITLSKLLYIGIIFALSKSNLYIKDK